MSKDRKKAMDIFLSQMAVVILAIGKVGNSMGKASTRMQMAQNTKSNTPTDAEPTAEQNPNQKHSKT